jgi:hypothetical protein
MLGYLRSFAPWLAFGAISAIDWRLGAVIGLATAVTTTLYARRRQPLDALVLDIGAVMFFAVLAVIGFADADSPVVGWVATLSVAWLAVIAWVSLRARRPFTLGIARQSTPREMWTNPVFYRVNATITAVWAATFTVITAGTVLVRITHAGTGPAVAVHGDYLVPVVFTRRYPAIVRRYANQSANREPIRRITRDRR